MGKVSIPSFLGARVPLIMPFQMLKGEDTEYQLGDGEHEEDAEEYTDISLATL